VAFTLNKAGFCVISDFRDKLHEICAFLGYFAAHSGDLLTTFRETYLSHLEVSRIPGILDTSRWDR
jgi:hypothetical protein